MPKPFYGSSNTSPSSSSGRIFVSTLTRIQENIPCDPSGNDRQRSDLNLKLKQTLHAPLASPEEFTPSPTKSGTSTPHHNHHHPLTSRSSGGGSDVLMTSIPESIHPTIPLGEKGLLSRVAQRKQEESNFQPTPAPRSGVFSISKLSPDIYTFRTFLKQKFLMESSIRKSCAVDLMKLKSNIRLETKSCRILPLTYVTKYDMT